MADIQIVKGEVANTAASLSAGSTLVMVDALQRDEESTLTAVASAQTLYEDFSKPTRCLHNGIQRQQKSLQEDIIARL